MEDLQQKLKRIIESRAWSAEDRQWLLNYLERNETVELKGLMQQQFNEVLQQEDKTKDEKAIQLLERIRERINPNTERVAVISMANWKRMAAAVAVVMLMLSGIYFLFLNKPQVELARTETIDQPVPIIIPGGYRAVLKLADGSQIILDSAQNGLLTKQGGTTIIKSDNGQLAYTSSTENPTELLYNIIATPRGGQYQLVLADGSKVWLNSASSLRFPAAFTGRERKVEITGEAYFEIAKDVSRPFIVNVAGKEEVEVLGTHFNINSYEDESTINTTLLEGAVKIKILASNKSQFLKPGQQAKLNPGGQIVVNNEVDLEEVMAWKNGKFQFGEAADIATIMRQISRWYDVEVEYKGTVTKHIGGTISRNVPVLKVFELLEMTGTVKFQVAGRKVIVMPQKK